jgi:Xaa-Pro aminopeptidase
MKNLISIISLVFLTSACNNSSDFTYRSHLLADIDDLTFSEDHAKIYSERRNDLLTKIGNGAVILRSDYSYNGGRHEYKAAENFYYLTGFSQPESALVLSRNSQYPYTLFITKKSIREEIYTGKSPDIKEIMNKYKPDTFLSSEKFDNIIEGILGSGKPVYIDFNDDSVKERIFDAVGRMKSAGSYVYDLADILNEMRVHKDDLEISMIQKAVDITGEAFKNACAICRPGMYEFEIEAMIEYTFRKYGSSMPAFESIVGSGPNAVTLHYWQNNRKIKDGDLLLMDIGAEYGYYASDITRTIPVNGKFSEEQKKIYDLVLKAQKAAIAEMAPGEYIVEGQNRCNAIIADGLYEIGLMTDPGSIWQKKFYVLYPISHYLGLYVHDVGDYGATYAEFRKNMAIDTTYGRLLEQGMVLTAEPGLYFRSDGLSQLYALFANEVDTGEIREFIARVTPVYEKYKNIGVRIEDDVLITEYGHVVLSEKIPKEIEEIENLTGSRRH